jgi:hypothetical protein
VSLRKSIGVDRFLFGMDYPHPEGTWPNTAEWLRTSFGDVPEDELRLLLGGNALNIYSLDAARLRAIADRVGPTVADIRGPYELDAPLLANFHERSGFNRAAEQPDPAFFASWLDDDVLATAGGR